jgi:hypothetical protein
MSEVVWLSLRLQQNEYELVDSVRQVVEFWTAPAGRGS